MTALFFSWGDIITLLQSCQYLFTEDYSPLFQKTAIISLRKRLGAYSITEARSWKGGKMEATDKKKALYLLFTVGEKRFALPAGEVERVIAAVEIIALPDSPEFLRGVINYGGRLVPVLDLRVRFGLPFRRVLTSDYIILVSQEPSGEEERSGLYAFLVERVEGVFPVSVERVSPPGATDEQYAGLLNDDERIVFIRTSDSLFSVSKDLRERVDRLNHSGEGALS